MQGAIVLLLSVLLLVACQPQIAFVEVTRLIEPMVSAAVPTAAVLEVTRVVPQEVTRVALEEVIVEVTKAPLGSIERPVQLLFAPTVNTAVITSRGQLLAQALADATGRRFEVGVLDSEGSVIDLICNAPVDTIGFLSAMGYVAAHERCGAQVASVAVGPDGYTWEAGMIITRRDRGLSSLEDLAGQRWAVPDSTSVTSFLYIQAMLADAGVEVGEIVEVPGDSSAMLAVYNREVDFATATFIPPIMPYEERLWEYGVDSPEVWRRLGIAPARSPIGYVLVAGEPQFGGYRLRDARAGIFDTTRGIFNETTILALSAPIPNETIAFGADFPLGLARQIMAVLPAFAASEACAASLCATDFFAWAGLEPAGDTAYEPLRFLLETPGLSEEQVMRRETGD